MFHDFPWTILGMILIVLILGKYFGDIYNLDYSMCRIRKYIDIYKFFAYSNMGFSL